ncbi:CDP-alcohol phosphatidyltransferase family protein [Chloroflexota bacterium]
MPVNRLPGIRRNLAESFAQPVVSILVRTSIAPDALTWSGFFLSMGAAVLIITVHPFAAGFAVLVAGFFDILDGALARRTNRATRFGAVLDSTLDRLSEAVLLLSILVVYTREQSDVGILVVGVALISSSLVSYIRARAEASSLDCQIGLFTRAERMIVLVLGLWLSQIDYALIIALAIISLFSFVTAGQRLVYVWRQTRIIAS